MSETEDKHDAAAAPESDPADPVKGQEGPIDGQPVEVTPTREEGDLAIEDPHNLAEDEKEALDIVAGWEISGRFRVYFPRKQIN